MQITWTTLKNFATDRKLSIQFVDLTDSYWLKAFDGPFSIEYTLFKDGGADQIDFETNFKPNGNKTPENIVTTQFELNNKDLKVATEKCVFDSSGIASVAVKSPGKSNPGNDEDKDGRFISGGEAWIEPLDADDRITKVQVVDTDRMIAWGVAMQMNPAATAPMDDATTGAAIGIPSYPVVKTYHDSELDPSLHGVRIPFKRGLVEVETLGGYGFIGAGFYLEIHAQTTSAAPTTKTLYMNIIWGKLST